ncbi:MAG: RNA polymerase sigma factor [Planctomycetales bacterium]|nr:RNA polymerase sigma factor [Planctomycetales bacterium]
MSTPRGMTALSEPPPAEAHQGKALESLVRAHHQTVWRLLRFLGASPDEAEDLTQETFLAVLRSSYEHRSDRESTAFLRAVARNQLLMLRRRQQREVETVEIEAAELVWAAQVEPLGWQEYTQSLRNCVGKLAGRAAQAVNLCYREGFGRSEIAERLDMHPDGVKTLLRRTRGVLRECVEKTMRREQRGASDREP